MNVTKKHYIMWR